MKWFPTFLAAFVVAGCTSRIPYSATMPDSRHHPTALDRYVAEPDPTYSWHVVETNAGAGISYAAIDLTSQTWLTPKEVNNPVWRHWLVVVRPDDVAHSTGLLFIGGGSNKDGKPPKPSAEIIALAKATRSVVAELKNVPNQPLIFGGDGKERVEDDLISYSWDKYLRTGDERWPARLPMTKAAVRAMDTITAHCATPSGGQTRVDRFVVAGGSKRGWTTWTAAIVDPRVVAICPIVIDMLNIEKSFQHHYQAYGFYAPAVDEYVNAGIMDWQGTPQYRALMKIEEPFEYRDRLKLPKLILNATGDQFFLPDSSRFYFDQLPGVKYLRYVPNADHSLKGSDAWETLIAWHHATLNHTPLPELNWTTARDGTLEAKTSMQPVAVNLWQATNPNARDFRVDTIGRTWTSSPVTADSGGGYRASVAAPTSGWTAYMLEFTYDLGGPTRTKFTTPVRVIPDTLPHRAPVPNRR